MMAGAIHQIDRRRRSSPGAVLGVAVLLAGLHAAPVAAQSGEWPTLTGAGLEYLSRTGALQISFSGQLDLEGMHVSDSWVGLIDRVANEAPTPDNQTNCANCHIGMAYRGTGGLLPSYRLRLFTDIFVGDHVYSLIELRSDRGHAPSDGDVQARVEQAYVRFTDTDGSLGLQLGRFASPFGSYALRHNTVVDPFLRPPLAYDFRTVMNRGVVPRNEALLFEWRHVPQFFRKPGTPPVWEVPYQWGAMAFAAIGPIDLRVASMNSAPSSGPATWAFDWDRQKDPSWVVAARTRLSADLEVGTSYNRGPWMAPLTAGVINPWPNAGPNDPPPTWWDFDQEIASVDFTFARGATMVRGEAMLDRWEVPNIRDRPTEHTYSLEAQRDLSAGFFAALRVGHIDFRPLDFDGSEDEGGPRDWDNDVTRFEGSLGYRLARNAGILFSAFEQLQDDATDADSRFLGLRLWWAF